MYFRVRYVRNHLSYRSRVRSATFELWFFFNHLIEKYIFLIIIIRVLFSPSERCLFIYALRYLALVELFYDRSRSKFIANFILPDTGTTKRIPGEIKVLVGPTRNGGSVNIKLLSYLEGSRTKYPIETVFLRQNIPWIKMTKLWSTKFVNE